MNASSVQIKFHLSLQSWLLSYSSTSLWPISALTSNIRLHVYSISIVHTTRDCNDSVYNNLGRSFMCCRRNMPLDAATDCISCGRTFMISPDSSGSKLLKASNVSFLANVILTFTFAICYLPSVCRLSVVCLSVVCDVGAPYSGG